MHCNDFLGMRINARKQTIPSVVLLAVCKGKDCDNLFALLSVFIAFWTKIVLCNNTPITNNTSKHKCSAHKNHHNYPIQQQQKQLNV